MLQWCRRGRALRRGHLPRKEESSKFRPAVRATVRRNPRPIVNWPHIVRPSRRRRGPKTSKRGCSVPLRLCRSDNQLCTLLRVDDEPSALLIIMLSTILGVLVAMLLSYLGLRFRCCLTRRLRSVEDQRVGGDGSALPSTTFSQSDASDAEEHSPPCKDEGTQCDDWQRYSKDEVEH